MLLTHTAGFSYPWYNQDLLNWVHQNGPKAYDEQLKYPLVHEPGTHFDYSVCLDWVGKVVEALSGLSLEEYAKSGSAEAAANKLLHCKTVTVVADTRTHLRATWYEGHDMAYRPASRFAEAHGDAARLGRRLGVQAARVAGLVCAQLASSNHRLDPEKEWGGAGVVCTGRDYLTVLATILNGGQAPNGTRILKRETVDLMCVPTCPRRSRSMRQKGGEVANDRLTDHTAEIPHRGGLEVNGSVAGVDATYAAGPLVLLPGQRKGWGLCSLREPSARSH